MAISSNLGFPRMGQRRELKKALEAYWSGRASGDDLTQTARQLRERHWLLQKDLGLDHIPSNDFSLYDHVLDTAVMVGAIPQRYPRDGAFIDMSTYFLMARGGALKGNPGISLPAMEMTKWFDTNYHYIVPEFSKGQCFKLQDRRVIDTYLEARQLGIETRPVLLGPVSFVLLGKIKSDALTTAELVEQVLPVYETVLMELASHGAGWVQMDEPCLVWTLDSHVVEIFSKTYQRLARVSQTPKKMMTTYFGDVGRNLPLLGSLPVDGVHVDLVRSSRPIDDILDALNDSVLVSMGVVDGRNIWKADFERTNALLQKVAARIGKDRIAVGPSCSLLHVPVDLELETQLDEELKAWMSYAKQKVEEIVVLTRAVNDGSDAVEEAFSQNKAAWASRRSSIRVHNPNVKKKLAAVSDADTKRQSVFRDRNRMQQEHLNLPGFPTTTIGSFPQTQAIRRARADFRAGRITEEEYEAFIKKETQDTVSFQEEIGLDVLVHGEFERNDMVEYFGEQLEGFATTQHGWVQSYGSRCVKPPIVFGDVLRTKPMTVRWSTYAQSLTSKPVKGMLTGPVTILQWSFVRDDQPRSETCRQVALAIREETVDLEAAGIKVIQIDEPALREGLPLRKEEWDSYLSWAVNAFRLASCGVRDTTQIHTHMCYSEFNDIIGAIAELDADVISIESSRSDMELLSAFAQFKYPNMIGPGVYDIHSPRIPSVAEMVTLLQKATDVLSPPQIWVNPDCGLKTRRWEEVKPSLTHMIAAAFEMRQRLDRRQAHELNEWM